MAEKKPPKKSPNTAPSLGKAAPRGEPPLPSRSGLDRLFTLSHPDPHGILGAHPISGGYIVRAFRPDAVELALLLKGRRRQAMEKVDSAGLFQLELPGAQAVPSYRLQVTCEDGARFAFRDPYSYLPTLGDLDLHLFGEGRHNRIDEKLGAHLLKHQDVRGMAFAVWAPSARGVSLVGDFNSWDGRMHPMRMMGVSGVWELFIPELKAGARYKFEIRGKDGRLFNKSDPFAQATEIPPSTASVIYESKFKFRDAPWRERQAKADPLRQPISIYEVHMGSWRDAPKGGRPLTYREAAKTLGDYVEEMGFTHVEFMPLTEHPFGGSWGYQVGGYYAPTARFGEPDDLRYMIDQLHRRGIGVILDWVPGHFPKDDFALGRFDGTALYEHEDPRMGEHPDWGTLIFNYGRKEVCNFLLGSALYWLRSFHFDGLRLDAVASMLYRDYSRKAGQWLPNIHGGRENLEAIAFLTQLNEVAHQEHPGTLIIAEESTSWPGVSRPTFTGGLGFGFKWNMGWMHDTLNYFSKEPIHRRFNHHNLTFGLLYAWSEHFILPLSHDEVVHGKGSLINKMPGDRWQKFANLRALYGHMWAHPGRKLLFMGCEFGQWAEWNHNRQLDWHLLKEDSHRGLQRLVRDLNRLYRAEPALWQADSEPEGFEWIDEGNADENVLAYMRKTPGNGEQLICVGNFSPVVRKHYRVGLPREGAYRELLNTDSTYYGGSNIGNLGTIQAEPHPWHGQPWSATLVLPPLATVWLKAL